MELEKDRSTAPAIVPTAMSGAEGQKAEVLHRGTTLIEAAILKAAARAAGNKATLFKLAAPAHRLVAAARHRRRRHAAAPRGRRCSAASRAPP